MVPLAGILFERPVTMKVIFVVIVVASSGFAVGLP